MTMLKEKVNIRTQKVYIKIRRKQIMTEKWTWKWDTKFVSVKIQFHPPKGAQFLLILTSTFCHKISFWEHFVFVVDWQRLIPVTQMKAFIESSSPDASFISLLSTNKSWCSEPNNFWPPQHLKDRSSLKNTNSVFKTCIGRFGSDTSIKTKQAWSSRRIRCTRKDWSIGSMTDSIKWMNNALILAEQW